jgi:hypothetical protein
VLIDVLAELPCPGDVLAEPPWPAGVHAETIAAARTASTGGLVCIGDNASRSNPSASSLVSRKPALRRLGPFDECTGRLNGDSLPVDWLPLGGLDEMRCGRAEPAAPCREPGGRRMWQAGLITTSVGRSMERIEIQRAQGASSAGSCAEPGAVTSRTAGTACHLTPSEQAQ